MPVKKITLICLLLICSHPVFAKTIYITDKLEVQLKANEREDSETLETVSSGTPLKFIVRRNSGYTKVKMSDGRYAFVLTNKIMHDKPQAFILKKTLTELAKVKEENTLITAELETLKGDSNSSATVTENLTKEREQLRSELAEIRYTAANAIKLKNQRDKLQEDFIQVNKTLEQIKLEKKTLETSANQDWFLYGGILSIFGVLLGFILPKLSWRRKAHNWDASF